ncbi:EAL domain-containing protein, partial [Hydrogenimonas sp.]|uniref:EAL domain-containing protein n=1 Tax=Hydrogenimonas sp. TaxID=2231112 RepID=UPI0026019BCA
MKRLLFKVVVALLAALLGVGLMLYQQNQMKEGFEIPQRVNRDLQTLHAEIIALQHTVLEANYFLYFNNDLIYERINGIRSQIDGLLKYPHLTNKYHRKSYQALLRLKRHFSELAETINTFLTLNASLKNSSIYLPTLALKAYDLFDINDPGERRIILTLSKINASLFLTKNALDESFIKELTLYKNDLTGMMGEADSKPKKRLLETSIRHLDLFIQLFPKFHRQLRVILDPSIQRDLHNIMNLFSRESSAELQKINQLGVILLILYLVTIGIVLYFVFHSEKEFIRLKRTQEQLQRSLITDHLTGLGNREAYVQQYERMKNPALILVNIDRFKHINEFYGSTVGDHLLQAVAQLLEETMPRRSDAHLYRLGGDDFGILFECDDPQNLKYVIVDILDRFDEETFTIDNLAIDISISIGASTAGKLFETADMALKTVKSSRRKRYAIYEPSLDVSETIASNIHALRQLKTAISQDAVIPFFQPIIDLRSGKTLKYEALARLRIGEHETIAPFFFIEAAKQAKLSGVITTRILKQTLTIAEKTQATFSVNLSAEDITSEHDKRQIFALLEEYKEIASLIVFEILETEEIEDYEIISEFIRQVKRYGCKISIDDFGSGYSNFEKLLQLDIDIIKIDGSLIKDVDHNTHAELIVQTIVDFAKGAQLVTVAEFVHSKAVLDKVKVLGVDYAQGYYLG